VRNAPEGFGGELTALHNVTILRGLQGFNEIEFSLASVTKKTVDTLLKNDGPNGQR